MTVPQSHTAANGFEARGITRTGHLQFDADVKTVFPLFTPEGERHWAKGWDPEIVYPLDRNLAEGMVFRTRDKVEHVWTVVHYDPAKHSIAYNIVAHGMLVRRIKVRCRPAGPVHTDVDVTDSYVALSPDGNVFIEHLTEANYASKMVQWKEAIGGYLATLTISPQ